jgi:NADPH-dependent 2,4-dienoyl-CoA reductase/sulfur reductase-like enzyme/rhodanese-related sulfurtransferase
MKLVIVGGVAGGATAAARARRLSEEAQIDIYERGGHVSFANCGLPYFIGGEIQKRESLLLQTPEGFWKRYRIRVHLRCEVERIDPVKKEVEIRNLEDGTLRSEPYDKLILSPGAAPVRPPLPGIDDPGVHCLRNMDDLDRIVAAVPGSKRAVVVGGGFIGLEMAENLVHLGLQVNIVEMLPQVMAPLDPEMAQPIQKELNDRGVELFLGNPVKGFDRDRGTLRVLLGKGDPLNADLVIFSVGVRPEVNLARGAGLDLGTLGGIRVDDTLRTSDPDIFAVGDAVEAKHFVTGKPALIPLAGPANRQARIAADNCLGRHSKYRGTQGTSIVRVFSLTAATTGAAEKTLKANGMPYRQVHLHPKDHAGYYPGSESISMKLLFSPEDGRILGAQAVGKQGVDKRIDVLATAIQAGMTLDDLEEVELAYAPPFGSAKDAVNMAGFVGGNLMRGDVEITEADAIPPDVCVVDVRDPEELTETGSIPGAVNIPLPQLRDRLGELPRDRPLVVTCAIGLRGYIACRFLKQNGYRCTNLSGGYKTYRAYQGLFKP